MITGIGTDIVKIERIQKVCAKQTFLQKYFSEAENELFAKRRYSPQTIAANFAAKEAFAKALGTGFSNMRLADISVLRDEKGTPYIEYPGAENWKIHVSLSHEQEYATAFVVIETQEG